MTKTNPFLLFISVEQPPLSYILIIFFCIEVVANLTYYQFKIEGRLHLQENSYTHQ